MIIPITMVIHGTFHNKLHNKSFLPPLSSNDQSVRNWFFYLAILAPYTERRRKFVYSKQKRKYPCSLQMISMHSQHRFIYKYSHLEIFTIGARAFHITAPFSFGISSCQVWHVFLLLEFPAFNSFLPVYTTKPIRIQVLRRVYYSHGNCCNKTNPISKKVP